MRWLSVVAVCLFLTLSSGCLEADVAGTDEDASSSSSSTSSASKSSTTSSKTTTSSSSGTQAPAAAAPVAPTANLTASTLNGTAPLEVTFQVNGTAPGTLAWTLSSNGTQLGSGASLPANVTWTFNATGEHAVVLLVSGTAGNGTSNATASLTITVEAGEAVAPAEEVVLCPTDTAAIEIPGAGLYATPMDSLASPPFSVGSLWVYRESNGMPGLQRNDDTMPTACATPDTIIF